MKNIELYCKFYLNANQSLEAIENIISQHYSSNFQYGSIATDRIHISCFTNTDRDGKDFIYWPYYIEFEPEDEDNYHDYQAFLSKAKDLNNLLKSHGIETVIACDFEDEFNIE